MTVKFQVERRPIGPTGKVHYGREKGDGVAVLSNPNHETLLGTNEKKAMNSARPLHTGQSGRPKYVPMGLDVPLLVKGSNVEEYSHMVEQVGEPWLVFSSHHSADAAVASAAPLAAAIGADNVRIIKVISHTTEFKLG